jgi:hypothetical protein
MQMKPHLAVLFILAGLSAGSAKAVTYFDDGRNHVVDYAINDDVWVDYEKPSARTHLELWDGGSISPNLKSYGRSRITILGGSIEKALETNDNSRADIYGGSIRSVVAQSYSRVTIHSGSTAGKIFAYNNSQVTISGGLVELQILAYDNSQFTILGGDIASEIFAKDSGWLTFFGTDFAINSEGVYPGAIASYYAFSGKDPYDRPCLTGKITGTLADGSELESTFYIYDDSDITFAIPEPAAFLLLALGAALLRRRHCISGRCATHDAKGCLSVKPAPKRVTA